MRELATANKLTSTAAMNGADDVALTYDYSKIADEHRATVRSAATDIKRRLVRSQEDLVIAGQRLNEVKEMLEHGQFEMWIGTEFNWSLRTAQRLMSAADRFGGKNDTVSFLNSSVLYMLSSPTVPDEAIERAVAEAKANGASPTKARVKQIIEDHETPQQQADRYRREAAAKRRRQDIAAGRIVDQPAAEQVVDVQPSVIVHQEPDLLENDDMRPPIASECPVAAPTPHQARQAAIHAELCYWRDASARTGVLGVLTGNYSVSLPLNRAIMAALELLKENVRE